MKNNVSKNEGLHFNVAKTLDEVIEGLQVVYLSYLKRDLILPNPFNIYINNHMISNKSVVVNGKINGVTVSTASSYVDGPNGLALDSLYPNELNKLRNQNCRLMQVCQLAEHLPTLIKSIKSILKTTIYVSFFGYYQGATDAVISVHPHHVKYYERFLSFEQIGPEKIDTSINNNPGVLLRLDWYKKTVKKKIPRGLEILMSNQPAKTVFEDHFELTKESIAGSVIEEYFAACN